MKPQDVVLAFVANLGLCLRGLHGVTRGVSRQAPTEPLKAELVDGSSVRSGRIEGLGAFQLHGSGCLFEMDSGVQVDIDWNNSGKAIFDLWRLCMFARSTGLVITEDDLARACRDLVGAGVLDETEAGWFMVRA